MHSTGFQSHVSRSRTCTSLKSLRANPEPPYPPNTYIFEPIRVTEWPPLYWINDRNIRRILEMIKMIIIAQQIWIILEHSLNLISINCDDFFSFLVSPFVYISHLGIGTSGQLRLNISSPSGLVSVTPKIHLLSIYIQTRMYVRDIIFKKKMHRFGSSEVIS